MKCELCTMGFDYLYDISPIYAHLIGHTNAIYSIEHRRKSTKPARQICDMCLHDVMLDSQWTHGTHARLQFLIGLEAARSFVNDAAEYLGRILDHGYGCLDAMCPACDGNNDNRMSMGLYDSYSNFPHLKKLNDDALKAFPEVRRKNYGFIHCYGCSVKHEIKVIQEIPANELPIHLGTFTTKKAQKFYEERLKRGE